MGGLAYWQNDVMTVHATPTRRRWTIIIELDDPAGIADGTYNLAFAFGLEQEQDTAHAPCSSGAGRLPRAG